MPAIRAIGFRRAGLSGGKASDDIVLEAQDRHLRRKLIVTRKGREVLVDLAKPVKLEQGDHLLLEDGSQIAIIAREENLMEVRGRDAAHLMKLAWHIGNRHLEAQIEKERILIRRDAVIAEMLAHQGASVKDVTERFEPEHGAYHGHAH